MLQLGALTRVPLSFLCLCSEAIQCSIPVLIPGLLSLLLANSDAATRRKAPAVMFSSRTALLTSASPIRLAVQWTHVRCGHQQKHLSVVAKLYLDSGLQSDSV